MRDQHDEAELAADLRHDELIVALAEMKERLARLETLVKQIALSLGIR
jgi:hypothetical protein